MQFNIIIHENRFEVSEYHTKKLREEVKKNGGPIRAYIETLMPESRQQRKYLMGGLMKLAVFLDGQDYKDNEVCERYFEYYKTEFSPELLKIHGKIVTFGKSTKGSKAINNFITKLQDYIHEQHGIAYNNPAMNPEEYNKWRDELSMQSTEDFIEYCCRMKYI